MFVTLPDRLSGYVPKGYEIMMCLATMRISDPGKLYFHILPGQKNPVPNSGEIQCASGAWVQVQGSGVGIWLADAENMSANYFRAFYSITTGDAQVANFPT